MTRLTLRLQPGSRSSLSLTRIGDIDSAPIPHGAFDLQIREGWIGKGNDGSVIVSMFTEGRQPGRPEHTWATVNAAMLAMAGR